jgi:iron(III) transport system substrate-binding protein
LWTAVKEGLLQPVHSPILDKRIPAEYRHPDGLWYGFSRRARIIFYDKARIDPSGLTTYASLADPKYKGLICTRSSTDVYMVSLLAAMIAHNGEQKAQAWAQGLWNNRARDPEGADLDQIRSVASGQCGIAVANTYYFARALRAGNMPGLQHPGPIDKIAWIFPDQNGNGAHVNISGAGVLKYAPDKANAIKFLEYLASDSAQKYFASGNDEYPVVPGAAIDPVVASLGTFKPDALNLSALGTNQDKAIEIYTRIGYK